MNSETEFELNSLREQLANAEKLVERSRRRDELARQAANIGYWDLDPSTGELQWSPEVLPLMAGVASGEYDTTMENFTKFVHPEDIDKTLKTVSEAMESHAPFAVEYRVTHQDDSLHWIRGWGGTVEDGTGLHRMIGAVMDITESRQLQERISQTMKMATLGEMSTGIAHELNQPLHAIGLFASNIQRKIKLGKADSDYISQKLDKIIEQVERASAITDHMRLFGRTPGDDYELLDIKRVTENVLRMLREQYRLNNVDLVVKAPDYVAPIASDQVQMEQVLLNLLTNALDATLESGKPEKSISIIIEQADGMVLIKIEDTGTGIAKEALPKVFEPFFTTKEIGKGTGLGLSISYGIIESMGGTIEATNTAKGARFTISLPVG